jgi:TP901 family phage tail tape measure protein
VAGELPPVVAKFIADLSDYVGPLEDAIKATEDWATGLKGLSGEADTTAGATDILGDSVNRVAALEQDLADAALQAADAEFNLAMASRESTAAGSEYASALDEMSSATLRVLDLQLELAAAEKEAAASADTATASTAALGDAQEDTAGKTEASSGLLASAGSKLLLVGLAAAAAGGESVHMAADFQQSMTRLVTSAGETEANIGLVSQGILALSVSTNTSTEQLAEGMYMVESAGFHGAAGLQVLKASAEGAAAEGADLYTVANAVTSALNAYSMKSSQAITVTNEMVTAVGQGKMTMQDLSTALAAVLPVAAAAKLSFPQVAGAIATMTSQGMSAQWAAENLRATITSLQDPSQEQIGEMQQLGVNSIQLAKNIGKNGLTGTINDLYVAVMKGMGPAGLVLLNSFNKSQLASQSATEMIAAMPASIKKTAQAYLNGSLSVAQWQKVMYSSSNSAVTNNLLQQFASVVSVAKGFNDQLKQGGGDAQTFTAALSKVMGNAVGLQTALMVGGAHMSTFKANVQAVANAAKTSGTNVNNWALIQHNFNFQLGSAEKAVEAAAIAMGTALLPAATAVVHAIGTLSAFFEKNAAASKLLAIAIGTLLAGAIEHGLMKSIGMATGGIEDMIGRGRDLVQFFTGAAGEASGFSKMLTRLSTAYNATRASSEAATTATEAEAVATDGAAASADGAAASFGLLEIALSPIGLAVIAVIALGVAAYELYTHFKSVRDAVADAGHFFIMLWDDVKKLATGMNLLKLGLAVVLGPVGLLIDGIIELYQHCSAFRDVVDDVARDIASIWDAAIGKIIGVFHRLAGEGLNWVKQQLALFTQFWQQHGAEVREITKAVWTAIVAVFHAAMSTIVTTVKGDWEVIQVVFKFAAGVITAIVTALWTAVLSITKAAWGILGPFVEAAVTLMSGVIKAALDMIEAFWKVTWDVVIAVLKITWAIISNTIRSAIELVLGIIGIALDLLTGHWSKAWHDLVTLASEEMHNIVSTIESVASDFGTLLYSAGQALIHGLISGFESMAGSAFSAIKGLASGLWHSALSAFGIASPSTKFAYIGAMITAGLASGIQSTAKQAVEASHQLAGMITEALSAGEVTAAQAQSLRASLTKALGTAMSTTIVTSLMGNIGQVKSAVQSLVSTVSTMVSGGIITGSQGSSLTKWLEADNARLGALTDARAKIAAQITTAKNFATSTTTSITGAFDLSSAASATGGGTATGIVANLHADVASIKSFSANIQKLAKMGLNKTYLGQLISMGPEQGGPLAAELVASNVGIIRQINTAESQIQSSATSMGKSAADVMYDSGKDAGRGFLSGLEAQEKQINTIMQRIAQGMVSTLRKELGISSPSRVMMQHGEMIAEGLAQGMQNGAQRVIKASSVLAAAVGSGMVGPGIITSHGSALQLTVNLTSKTVGEVNKQQLWTAVQQQTFRYNIRNSGQVTGVMKPA